VEEMAAKGKDVELGSRVRAVRVGKAPFTVPAGTRGTVDYISRVNVEGSRFTQVGVRWDDDRYFICCLPPDALEVL